MGAGRVGTATGLHGAQGVSPGACFPKKTGEHGAQPKPGRAGLRCRLFRRRLLCTRRLGRLQTLQHSLGCSSPGPARAHQQQTTREGALEGQPELPRPLTERTTRCRAWATARRAASCLPCSLETHLQCLGGGGGVSSPFRPLTLAPLFFPLCPSARTPRTMSSPAGARDGGARAALGHQRLGGQGWGPALPIRQWFPAPDVTDTILRNKLCSVSAQAPQEGWVVSVRRKVLTEAVGVDLLTALELTDLKQQCHLAMSCLCPRRPPVPGPRPLLVRRPEPWLLSASSLRNFCLALGRRLPSLVSRPHAPLEVGPRTAAVQRPRPVTTCTPLYRRGHGCTGGLGTCPATLLDPGQAQLPFLIC